MRKAVAKADVVHVCGECALGVWVTDHRHYDIWGRPICLQCKHQRFYVLRSQRACEHFKSKLNM